MGVKSILIYHRNIRLTKPKFALVHPSELRSNPWNTNRMTPSNQEKLDAAIKRFGGLFKPIIVRETATGLEILGGQHRWEASLRLGFTEVPVFNQGKISDAKAKEISLADNARYGADDTLALSELLKELGDNDDLQQFLPYSDADLTSIFQASNIALDDLEFDDPDEENAPDEAPEEKPAKAPKTHTIMRFKVPIADSEKITELIVEAQKDHGFTAADELTNAGDALVHLLLGA